MTAARGSRDLEGITQTVIMLAIGGAAGAASFPHVHDVAEAHGQGGWLAWADAIVLELMSLASGLEIRRRHRANTSIRFPGCVLACAVALSISAQVVEAEASVIGWTAAAVPALGFLVMVKIALARTANVSAGSADSPVAATTADIVAPTTAPASQSRRDGDADRTATSLAPITAALRDTSDDVSGLLPAALAAREALAQQGQRLSRQSLTHQLRQEGYTVSSARGSALVRLLKTSSSGH